MDLRHEPVPGLIRRLAMPASIGMIFSTLLNVTDTWYAGLLSSTALAALSLAGPVFFLVMTIGIGVGQATNALVGNRLGADRPDEARLMAFQAIGFAVLVSALAAFAAWLAMPWLFGLMGGEPPYLEPAVDYMTIVLLGSAFFALSIVMNSILNTRGDTVSYRNAQFGAFLANLGLDPLFMFALELGVAGAAVATICVQGGVLVWLTIKVWKLDFLNGAHRVEFVPLPARYLEIARQSVPTSVSMMLVAIGSLIIVAFVSRFGEQAMAAYAVALRIEQLALLPVVGINIAVLSLTSVNYGASDLARVRTIYSTGLRYAIGLMLLGAVSMLLFARQLMGLFTDVPAVLDVGVTYLHFEAFILPAYALTFLSTAVLQGLKRPVIAMYFNLVRQIVGQLLLFWIAIELLDMRISGIWGSVLLVNWVLAVAIVYAVRAAMRRAARDAMPPSGGPGTRSSGNRTIPAQDH